MLIIILSHMPRAFHLNVFEIGDMEPRTGHVQEYPTVPVQMSLSTMIVCKFLR